MPVSGWKSYFYEIELFGVVGYQTRYCICIFEYQRNNYGDLWPAILCDVETKLKYFNSVFSVSYSRQWQCIANAFRFGWAPIVKVVAVERFDVTRGIWSTGIMSVFSKNVRYALTMMNCHQIVHPHTSSCFQSAWNSFWTPVPTTAKFFLPFILVKRLSSTKFIEFIDSIQLNPQISLATKRGNLDRSACKDMLTTYVSAIVAAFFTGTIGRWFMCILQ